MATKQLSKEDQVTACLLTILQALVAEADKKFGENFMARWLNALSQATDPMDVMEVEVALQSKIADLRQKGFIKTPPAELRAKATEIVENNASYMWFGQATKYAHTLVLSSSS